MYTLVYRISGTSGSTGGHVTGFSTEAKAVAAGNKLQDSFTMQGRSVWYSVILVA